MSMTSVDIGPFPTTEDGSHVRLGYTKAMLEELYGEADLIPENISYCSGIISQKITTVLRIFGYPLKPGQN